jgi:hypothetical protein
MPASNPTEVAQPPSRGDYAVHEQALEFSCGLQLVSQALAQLNQGGLVFSGKEDVLRKEAVS